MLANVYNAIKNEQIIAPVLINWQRAREKWSTWLDKNNKSKIKSINISLIKRKGKKKIQPKNN